MGAHFGSVQVRSTDRDEVIRAAETVARLRKIKCLVGPAIRGWIGIYPQDSGQDQTIGEELAKLLLNDVIHLLVYDDDVFAYWLWRDKILVDSYWSEPGYFGEEDRREQEQMKGNPELLAALSNSDPKKLADLLSRDQSFTFEQERLAAFAKLLGISNAETAYEYLQDDEGEGIKGRKRFIEIPRDEIEKAKKAGVERRRQINQKIKQLKKEGLLLVHTTLKDHFPRAVKTSDGFLISYGSWQSENPPKLFKAPFADVQEIAIGSAKEFNSIDSDESGRRFAIVSAGRTSVMEYPSWNELLNVSEPDSAHAATISADGKLLAVSSRHETYVWRIDSRELIGKSKGKGVQLALHPSGDWLVRATSAGIIQLYDLKSNAIPRSFFVGGKHNISEAIVRGLQKQLEKVDPQAVENQQQVEWKKTMEQLVAAAKETIASEGNLDLQALQQQSQAVWQKHKALLQALKQGITSPFPQGTEHVASLEFSRSGEFLFCGTEASLHVYRFQEVIEHRGRELPKPIFLFQPKVAQSPHSSSYIYALQEERNSNVLVFGGIDGILWKMDLITGNVRELLRMPEQDRIYRLNLSPDDSHIGIFSHPYNPQQSKERKFIWSIWSYSKLCQTKIS